MNSNDSLESLGWRPHFQTQLDPEQAGIPVRVMAVHRDRVEVAGEAGRAVVDLNAHSAAMGLTVGDWILLDEGSDRIEVRLQPFALFKRRAPGSDATIQTIAANVDTLFIVTSANRDFNVARLERFLAIAHDAGVFPVIVITKTDLADAPEDFARSASSLSPGILIETLDAREPEQVKVLECWCGPGQTVALLGSSGVGKSTIINSLSGSEQSTSGVRDDDQRGRHTTTSRSMHALPGGGWLIDTPGMRELQLVDIGAALDDVFADVAALSERCRFDDCAHDTEPGCAVQAAIENEKLDPERLRRFRKLKAENRRNSESLAERRSRDKHQGRFYKSVIREKQSRKDES